MPSPGLLKTEKTLLSLAPRPISYWFGLTGSVYTGYFGGAVMRWLGRSILHGGWEKNCIMLPCFPRLHVVPPTLASCINRYQLKACDTSVNVSNRSLWASLIVVGLFIVKLSVQPTVVYCVDERCHSVRSRLVQLTIRTVVVVFVLQYVCKWQCLG